ncbi:ABC transporter substrate-binding protein [Ferrovibrio sp.]|uniref:ABC transporter substrate-binding protein n=1 Tax=Ferrovibrio sp. TaxID=1917215 RepID=UPI0025C6AA05|nr:ABC transporter substrate-binding protein [Ferrovibrio sp.]MBX3455322.1 ABC transporter substrate-binding protein [Ferrovibrio sp.]
MTSRYLASVFAAGMLFAGALSSGAAMAQDMPKIVLGMSGWTGFAPLSLAAEAGLFKKHGVDVEIKFIPQKERHLTVAAGATQAVATTVDTFIAYSAAGIPLTQVLLLDKSNGGDGLAVRGSINKITDLKGKTIAVDGAGTTPYFTLIAFMKRNGMGPKDVNFATLGPQPAAQAFIAGQYDAALTYEPYLSSVRNAPNAGKILLTTLDYPVVVDMVAFQPDYIKKNPKVVQGVVNGFFDALAMIKTDPAKSNEIMGSKVKQTGEQFAGSAKFISWQDKAANQAYFKGELQAFMKEAADIQLEAGVIRAIPALGPMVDDSFIK